MNSENHCPVQASIDRYYAGWDEDEAFDVAVYDRKEVLMCNLTPEQIQEALCEVPETSSLWKAIACAAENVTVFHRICLNNACDVMSSLVNALDDYAEKEARRQITDEQNNPPPPQEDTDYDD